MNRRESDHLQPQHRKSFALIDALKMDLSAVDLKTEVPLILWLTTCKCATYGNVGSYGFEKVPKVRIAISPPRSLKGREIRLDFS
jgi:hypothetical protein